MKAEYYNILVKEAREGKQEAVDAIIAQNARITRLAMLQAHIISFFAEAFVLRGLRMPRAMEAKSIQMRQLAEACFDEAPTSKTA